MPLLIIPLTIFGDRMFLTSHVFKGGYTNFMDVLYGVVLLALSLDIYEVLRRRLARLMLEPEAPSSARGSS